MKSARYAAFLGFAVIAACNTPQAEKQTVSRDACENSITAYGSRAALKADPDMVAVSLAAVPTPATAIGYGPSDKYRAELTLVNGEWSIARATGADSVQVEKTPEKEAGAVFLVLATPEKWSAHPVGEIITTLVGLENILTATAAASDCPTSAIPFRLSGTITNAKWSVVGRPEGAKGLIKDGNVTLVGIYDPIDSDRYFIPTGQKLHVHLVSEDGAISGHLSSFQNLVDGVLSLPTIE
jgi:hypothetical protein